MKKKYLVDSENVGDIWVPLLIASQPEDQVIVFYTQKSPHMNYENVRLLKETDKEAEFVKCYEGSNALDFQLVSQLGYLLREDADCEYVIVSNDTGFDAVVRYWTVRKMPVRRLSGKECSRQMSKNYSNAEIPVKTETVENIQPEAMPKNAEKPGPGTKTETVEEQEPAAKTKPAAEQEPAAKTEPAVKPECTIKTEVDEKPAHFGKAENATDKKQTQKELPVKEKQADMSLTDIVKKKNDEENVVKTLFSCISKDHLADFHNALVMFFGEAAGKELYQQIKGDPEYTTYWAKIPENSQKERFDIYCKIVFEHSELANTYPEDFSEFLWKANGKRNNLNSLRAALQGQYGKDKGMKYYSLFKSHIKIMNRM